MKYWKKFLLTGILILSIFFTLIYFFIFFAGKDIFVKKLESLTDKKVTLDYIRIHPPLNLVVKNLNIQGLVKIKKAIISPSVFHFFIGKIAFNRINLIKPQIIFQRTPPVVNKAEPGDLKGKVLSEQSEPKDTALSESKDAAEAPLTIPISESKLKEKGTFPFILKHLDIKNGELTFIDHTVGPGGIRLIVKDINFNLTDLYLYPVSAITNFELKGRIPWEKGKEGRIEASGWLNFFKKDMQAKLKVVSIDGVYLHPYYANWVDLKKARIENATLNFTSNITGLDNNLTAECRLELSDIARKSRSPEEDAEKAERITDTVLDIFRALNQGKIVLDFTIRTKMDNPEFGFGNIKMAFENKLASARNGKSLDLQNILLFPGKFLEGTVKSAADLSKAVIGGAFSIGKEFKKMLEDTFKKEK